MLRSRVIGTTSSFARAAQTSARASAWMTSRRFAATTTTALPGRAWAWGVKNWFTLSLPVLVFGCSQFPWVMRSGGTLQMETYKDAFVFGIFLASGLAIPLGQMRSVVAQRRLHAAIQLAVFGMAPFAFYQSSFWLRDHLGLPEPVCQGWRLFGCLPTSIGVSLAVTRLAHGNVPATLLNSAFGNLLGVLITPFLCEYISGRAASIDTASTVSKLMLLVAFPSVLGMALRHAIPVLARYDPVWGKMQPLCLLMVLANVFSNAFHNYGGGIPGMDVESIAKLFAACSAMNVALMTLMLVATTPLRFDAASRASAVFCAGQKTTAMGVPLMATMYGADPELGLLTLPMLCYHPVQAGVGSMYAAWLRPFLRL